MSRDVLGPVFLVDRSDVPAVERFAANVGCDPDVRLVVEGDDASFCVRLFGSDDEAETAWSWIYLGLGLPVRIRPLPKA